MSKIYKTFTEWADDNHADVTADARSGFLLMGYFKLTYAEIEQLNSRIEEMGKLHLSITDTLLTEIEQLKHRIVELEQPEPLRDFCYDLQEWVKQFVLDIDGFKHYYCYQDIRKAAYTYIKKQKNSQPTWGDESYYDKRYETIPRPSFFELEGEIVKLKQRIKELEQENSALEFNTRFSETFER